MIPRSCCVGRQCQCVRQIDSGVGLSRCNGKVEDFSQQHHAVQINALLILQHVRQYRRPRSSVALAKQKLRRIPTAVFHQETRNEPRKCLGIRVNTPERFACVLTCKPAKAGARHIDKNQVAHIEQAVGVVNQLVRRARQVRIAGRLYILWSQRSHVQPHRRTARPAVVEKRHRPLFRLGAGLEIRHVKHVRHGRRVGRLFGRRKRKLRARQRLSIRAELRIIGICRTNRNGPGDCRVRDVLPAQVDCGLCCRVGRGRSLGGFCRIAVGRGIDLSSFLLVLRANRRTRRKQRHSEYRNKNVQSRFH